jgi:hypothetical protein
MQIRSAPTGSRTRVYTAWRRGFARTRGRPPYRRVLVSVGAPLASHVRMRFPSGLIATPFTPVPSAAKGFSAPSCQRKALPVVAFGAVVRIAARSRPSSAGKNTSWSGSPTRRWDRMFHTSTVPGGFPGTGGWRNVTSRSPGAKLVHAADGGPVWPRRPLERRILVQDHASGPRSRRGCESGTSEYRCSSKHGCPRASVSLGRREPTPDHRGIAVQRCRIQLGWEIPRHGDPSGGHSTDRTRMERGPRGAQHTPARASRIRPLSSGEWRDIADDDLPPSVVLAGRQIRRVCDELRGGGLEVGRPSPKRLDLAHLRRNGSKVLDRRQRGRIQPRWEADRDGRDRTAQPVARPEDSGRASATSTPRPNPGTDDGGEGGAGGRGRIRPDRPIRRLRRFPGRHRRMEREVPHRGRPDRDEVVLASCSRLVCHIT